MSGGGGYLLSGITVSVDAATTGAPRKTGEPAAKRIKLDEISSSNNSSG